MSRGFTLIELLITIFILGILVSIAVPSYNSYLARGYRSDARAMLLQAASWIERQYLANNCYNYATPTDCATQSGTAIALPASLSSSPALGTAIYTIAFSAGPAQTTYTLQAGPIAGRAMDGDACGSYTIDQVGTRSLSGNPTQDEVADCWQQ